MIILVYADNNFCNKTKKYIEKYVLIFFFLLATEMSVLTM